ncbi:exodeoxyribonuclease V subunit gamma [Microlunatus sp. Gsoil 973]|uniref:exodeoxyribonuclease V subunit gamma n=1 Tax=Microlunatus sp. Gsoil 973 TaxID=2672569 RepID=UPI0012B478FA|nr:exodeoxyribonuclease V subunit gamma [Microlunatus sp. Gsoil 973]QGN32196.1 exodeoxyribonuclease V subunit gamma [Microlunatus sp. Gsoil 973]
MGLWVHRAERADRLATGLGMLLRDGLDDPFATEIVAVPTRGVERWLAQTLSHVLGIGTAGDGVCAGIDFPSPERMIGEALSGITGVDPRSDPWHPRRSVWPLLSVIDAARDEQWAQPLWRYLDRSDDLGTAGRRYGTARHLAGLFDSYAANRPQMLQHWLTGDDLDGSGKPLPSRMLWQAELWRRLHDEIDLPSPAERLPTVCRELLDDPTGSDLPDRLSIFGPTRLPYATLSVLAALARHRDVHLWLPHASPVLWSAISTALNGTEVITKDASGEVLPAAAGSRSGDAAVGLARHRLLAYLGRDTRELQLGLARLPAEIHDHLLDAADDDHRDRLLDRLQRDLAADRPLEQLEPRPIAADDDSIAVHAAHGPDRQVEVLRELVLGLLESDPTLEPRDIIVMCPDIETFAPLISAAFGSQVDEEDPTAGHPGHRLRVRLADRSLRQLNPLLEVLGRLFDLAESRVEASAVIDLCAAEPVANRFGFSDDDILRLRELVAASGVRWGLDPQHRRQFGMEAFGQNTWAAGLDRMLLGVAMDEDGQRYLGTTLPLDDIDAGDADLVGRLAEAVHRLSTVINTFDRRQPLRAWIAACRDALDLLTAVGSTDTWQVSQAYGELTRIAESAADRDEIRLTRREVRSVLADLFAGRPSRANFRTGTMTVATLLPMRSVPHRVICLLGLDDGVFPRSGRLDGDDLLTVDPWIGDRDRRSEDRQLLLDAIMSATEHLMIIYSGADPRTNARKPPAVPLGELLDVLDLAAKAPAGRVRDQIVRHHPLQPFDKINFDGSLAGPAGSGQPFSFDTDALAGARATLSVRSDPKPVYSADPLPSYQLGPVIDISDLISFFKHPIRSYLKTRTGFSPFWTPDVDEEDIPIMVDGLAAWRIGDRMLRRHLTGVDIDQLVNAEWRRGEVPPRQLGSRMLDPIARTVQEIAGRAAPLRDGEPCNVDILAEIEVPGPNGARRHALAGTVPGVYGERLVTVQYSKLNASHRLEAWIKLLAMTTTDPAPWQAVTVGQQGFGGGMTTLGPVTQEFARLVLADLVELYCSGLSAPLPLPPRTAAEYAEKRRENRSLPLVAAKARRSFEMECDACYRAVFGESVSLDQLLAIPSIPSEERGGIGEPSRFGTLARRVWNPLLMSEVIDR